MNSKVTLHVYFSAPYITSQQVIEFIRGLNHTKATGMDGLGPRILKMAAGVLEPSITSSINKHRLVMFPNRAIDSKNIPNT